MRQARKNEVETAVSCFGWPGAVEVDAERSNKIMDSRDL
jgi:hypothetical protein